jgi:hypothetical protein
MARTGRKAEAQEVTRGAWLSGDGVYRWNLHRQWAPGRRCDVWIMLNPSTADASLDDPTIRRCIAFSHRWGAGGIAVVNLFALRATDPEQLRTHPDPVGYRNDGVIMQEVIVARESDAKVIAAWGAHPMAVERARIVARNIGFLYCLGTTAAGAPRHPLYVRGDTELVPWRP